MSKEEKLVLHIKLTNYMLIFGSGIVGGAGYAGLVNAYIVYIALLVAAITSWYNTYRYFRAVRKKQIEILFTYNEHPVIVSIFLTTFVLLPLV